MAFAYKRSVTIDHTKCGAADSTNFPVLFNTTDATLKTVGNGGHVQNANGYDIAFYSDSGLSTALSFEIERYNASTGEYIAWVKVPTVSHTSDTVIYIAYGDSGISSNPSTTAAWNANYIGVFHLPDGSSLSVANSTSAANNGVNHSATATAGEIDGGAAFNGSSQYISIPYSSALNLSGAVTVSAWINRSSVLTLGTILGHMVTPAASLKTQYCFLVNAAGLSMLYSDASNVFHEYDVTSGLTTNTWQYAAFSLTWGTGSSMKIYIDGVLQSGSWTAGNGNGAIDGSSTEDGTIGHLDHSGAPLWYGGSLDEVRFSAGRTADEILTEFNNQSSPSTFYTLGSETPVGGGGNVISGAANDNADTTSGSVKVAVKASGGATETKDASAGSVKVAVKISGGATEGADSASGSVKVAVKISGGATEAADASAGTLTATQGYHVSGNANEGADASSGSVKVAVHISGGATEAADASAGSITATARTISGGATEGADASAGSLHNANPLPLPVQQGMGPGWNLFHHQPARVREHDSVEDDIRRILAKAEEAQSPKAKRQAVKELRSAVETAAVTVAPSNPFLAQQLERAARLEMSASAFLRNVNDALEKERIRQNDDMESFMIIAELAA